MLKKFNYTGWAEVQRGVFIDADLEHSLLEIKTESPPGSNKKVRVEFHDHKHVLAPAGGVILHFTSPPQFELKDCTTSRNNFLTAIPTDTNKVWTITLTRTSDISLVIHCNEVEVLHFVLSDTTCNYELRWMGKVYKWSHFWYKDIRYIRFDEDDTASDYYRGRSSR